ncbi:dihydrolipoamide dehydrogenase [Methylacidimicrobium cyclopophantes]|uniref:Dihydrolipoamide dehydrogenase n=1 Tax=Methylacidimicrobium cyclopophantes TaxID=1041766 RepID=A0A5E6MLZ8_9BACT|nr:NAD(P)/FAD-dependent oxidoreductase [Methylacidimicrobium cyclopophantes]VVM06444.1 dihydrolipoamide dehydrogenase [Methylacidimicrobium cyclopophantes]
MEPLFDVAVIGGGSAGFAAARTAAASGAHTVLVEGAERLGGLCILAGCMPTKALLESSRRWQAIREAQEFGFEARPIRADFSAILARAHRLVSEFAADRQNDLIHGDFRLIRAHAAFVDPHQLALTYPDGQQSLLRAKTFVLATGSRISHPPLPELSEIGFWDSDTVLEKTELPESLIVLGGGPVATEYAQFFARLGVAVSMIQRGPHLLKRFDSDLSAVLEEAFRDEGIELFTNASLVSAGRSGEQKRIRLVRHGAIQELVAEEIFLATGRTPALERLHLSAAGIDLCQRAPVVDSQMRTTMPHIFAAGDVVGIEEVVHIAVLQGEVAGENAARQARGVGPPFRQMDYRLTMEVVFTEPEIARLGLTEAAARQAGRPTLVARYPFADHGKALLKGMTRGFVKLLADPESGELLGAGIAGPEASELIHELTALLSVHATADDLARLPHYHPTLSEILTYPAEEIARRVAAFRSPVSPDSESREPTA